MTVTGFGIAPDHRHKHDRLPRPDFQPVTLNRPNVPTIDAVPTSMVSADLNHDGRADVVLTNSQANTISVLLNFP
jgi:FG-GAP repeat protein